MEGPVTGFLEQSVIRRVARLLKTGGIAVLPTDTLYGFHCVFSAAGSIERIRTLKGKRGKGGFILLASDITMVDRLVSRWPPGVREHLAAVWPATLTAILHASPQLPPILVRRDSVAVRVPAHDGLRSLVACVGQPLVSTSVNRTGEEPLRSIAGIRDSFPGLDAYISRRGRGGSLPSTVISFTVKPPRTVRAGRYPVT
ncbi:MAG: L-threonylcarbamoyladenylate synthase [bacterium]|nr:MAG: L-threonylcarbamoyladenylate synthase [bacterium]